MKFMMMVFVLIFVLVVIPLLAQDVVIVPGQRVSVDYVYNPDDGLTYMWCREGCDRFMSWAPLYALTQGFPDATTANCTLWAWQDAKEGTTWETIVDTTNGACR